MKKDQQIPQSLPTYICIFLVTCMVLVGTYAVALDEPEFGKPWDPKERQLTLLTQTTVEVGSDGSLILKEGILSKDSDGNIWETRRTGTGSKSPITFFLKTRASESQADTLNTGKGVEVKDANAVLKNDRIKIEALGATKICWLQERLAKGGFYQGCVDGISGPATSKAIETYRKQYSLLSVETSADTLFEHILYNQSIPDKPINIITPKNGLIFQQPKDNAIAPLEIYTADADLHYFVKITRPNSTRAILTIFIRSGQHIATNMPLGQYALKYAVGATWYSERCLFGRDTNFYEADRLFDFKRKGNQVSGYRVELILQIDGNLPTRKIDPMKF
jgi:peptidoglycan hydrolase-like protein with peptidoglycan-binding domain